MKKTYETFDDYYMENCSGKPIGEILKPDHIKEATKKGYVLLGDQYYKTNVPRYSHEALLLPDSFDAYATGNDAPDIKLVYNSHRYPVGQPTWLTVNDKGQFVINEPLFVRAFASYYDIKHMGGAFYDQHGYVADSTVSSHVYACIEPFVSKGLSRMTDSLTKAIGEATACELGRPDESKVFVADNECICFDMKSGSYECKTDLSPTIHRLHVKYDAAADCPTFKAYVADLLHEDDIPTLQEYMGYCLIPSTRGQGALFIKGEGGEGKSVLSRLMCDLFGRSAVAENLSKLETNRFALATLENIMLFVDDDLNTESLKETGTIKKVVTATIPLQVERKGKQPHAAHIYARLFCLGNTHISAAFDRSDGFYRRLILLTCKPIRADRGNDKFLRDKILDEMPGIFNWMLEGLQRLIRNNFEFTRSERAEQELKDKQLDENPVLRFVTESGWVTAVEGGEVTSRRLLAAFRAWCELNAITEPAERTITQEMRQALVKVAGAKHTKNVRSDGTKAAGYQGVALTSEGLKHTAHLNYYTPSARAY